MSRKAKSMKEKVYRIMQEFWYDKGEILQEHTRYYVEVQKSLLGFRYWSSIKEKEYDYYQPIKFKTEQEAHEFIERIKRSNKFSGRETKLVWADPQFKNMNGK